jgi:DNA-binding PadR family transcriptional regulator
MCESKLDLLEETLDIMVLQTLASMGIGHGYGIARCIERVSGNEFQLNQSTIYASLVRLQQRGQIASAGHRELATPGRTDGTRSCFAKGKR